ncbi:MAG: hypothetical protein ACI865_002315 [Flavobacteriaceae bacterium]|jgi:hypothetical protein
MCKFLFLVTVIFLVSCNSEVKDSESNIDVDRDSTDQVDIDSTDTIETISDYNFDGIDPKLRGEFKESLAKIEEQHGVQWDFCTCVVKNDSINIAFQQANLPDKQFDRLSNRFDVIDQKCKAFLAQNPNQTPDDRAIHEKKVRDCLKAARQ